jgi:hypothetical protein
VQDQESVPTKSLLQKLNGGGPHNNQTKFRALAEELINRGYSLDYISDAQIEELCVDGTYLLSKGGSYKTILVPACSYIPLETFDKLIELAKNGATILFHEFLPKDISGFANYDEKKKSYIESINTMVFEEIAWSGVEKASIGKGTFVINSDVKKLLPEAGILPESMVYSGLQYIRRKNSDGKTYFIKNLNSEKFNGYITLSTLEKSVAIFNPNTDQSGRAEVRSLELDAREVYLQLEPGETCLLRTFDKQIRGKKYPYFEPSGSPIIMDGNWELSFITGGPIMPDTRQLTQIMPWTDLKGEEFSSFSGTANYTKSFDMPADSSTAWLLNLGEVSESATVFLNGKKLVTLFSPPFQMIISSSQLSEGNNTLEIHVSNLMANRIIYMERNGMKYRNFYNVNFPARRAENRGNDGLFTSGNWEPYTSGLVGPVTLTPMNVVEF